MNDDGVAVGEISCYPDSCGSRGVAFVRGQLFKLNDLLAEPYSRNIAYAAAINSHGQIVCAGSPPVLLTPVDPPLTDLDGDCSTGFSDLTTLLTRWATSDDLADFDDDGLVGFSDLTMLLLEWG